MMKRFTLLCLSSFFLVSCTTAPDGNYGRFKDIPEIPEAIQYPEINLESRAEVGESIVKKEYRIRRALLNLSSDVNFFMPWLKRETSLPKGVYILKKMDAKVLLYVRELNITDGDGKTPPKIRHGVYVPLENPNQKEACFLTTELGDFCGSLAQTVFSEGSREISFPDAFRRELIYLGKTNNSITIMYREFTNDMIRPAFSQEMKYDLAEGIIIGYKGARFEVTKADNLGITYKVIRALD